MSGSGANVRRRLAARAGFARRLGIRPSRAERFRRRLTGQAQCEPSLAELGQWPAWPGEDARVQNEVWVLTALVAGRDSLLDEIDGTRLRRYAAVVGDERLEQVLSLPRGGGRALASPNELQAQGRRLAHSGLPPALARHLGFTAATDREAAVWVAEAEVIAMPGS